MKTSMKYPMCSEMHKISGEKKWRHKFCIRFCNFVYTFPVARR